MADNPKAFDPGPAIGETAERPGAVNEARRRVEASSGMMADRLENFIRRYSPDPRESPWAAQRHYEFQMDLMRLVVDLLRHQGNTLDYGLEVSFAEQWHHRMSQPLAFAIMSPKKE